jgi:hypothetical protein
MNTTAAGEENGVYQVTALTPRFSVADVEGANGLPFRSAMDPRVPSILNGIGQNGISTHYKQLKYLTAESDIIIASGWEARLIEAEAALDANQLQSFIDKINVGRSALGLVDATDPGTATGRVDLLFSERAFLMYATGQRLGDMRRLLAFYGGTASPRFPTGPHALGGNYGSDVNLPVPASARGPMYAGCDRLN